MRIVTPAKQAITIPTIAPVLNPASSTTESEKKFTITSFTQTYWHSPLGLSLT